MHDMNRRPLLKELTDSHGYVRCHECKSLPLIGIRGQDQNTTFSATIRSGCIALNETSGQSHEPLT